MFTYSKKYNLSESKNQTIQLINTIFLSLLYFLILKSAFKMYSIKNMKWSKIVDKDLKDPHELYFEFKNNFDLLYSCNLVKENMECQEFNEDKL